MKKKREGNFNISFRGYKRCDVDSFIDSLNGELNSMREQVLLARTVKDDNDRLSAELSELKQKESDVKTVLSVAIAKANDIKTDVKLQYALEIERLKLFQAKWTNAYEELKEHYHFDKDALTLEGVISDTSLKLEQALYKDFGISLSPTGDEAEQQFMAEAERLEISQDEINKLVERLKGELKKAV